MTYCGIILCMTHVYQPEGEPCDQGYRPRYSFVTDEKGFPYESLGRGRWEVLKKMSEEQDGWKKIGTFPAGRQPVGLWDAAMDPAYVLA